MNRIKNTKIYKTVSNKATEIVATGFVQGLVDIAQFALLAQLIIPYIKLAGLTLIDMIGQPIPSWGTGLYSVSFVSRLAHLTITAIAMYGLSKLETDVDKADEQKKTTFALRDLAFFGLVAYAVPFAGLLVHLICFALVAKIGIVGSVMNFKQFTEGVGVCWNSIECNAKKFNQWVQDRREQRSSARIAATKTP